MTKIADDHDKWACECHETCSHCLEPVLDSTLVETDEGRLCPQCLDERDLAW